MVNDVKVEIFQPRVNCDRYHLLYPDIILEEDINLEDYVLYSESGNAFNGFSNGIILDKPSTEIEDSRLLALSMNGVANRDRKYYLIKGVAPIRNDKSYVTIEYDSWLNKRDQLSFGEQNDLFQCSHYLINYPASDIETRYFKYIDPVPISPTNQFVDVIMLYHDSSQDCDKVYIIRDQNTVPSTFVAYSIWFKTFLTNCNLLERNIIAMYLSPFNLVHSNIWNLVFTIADCNVYEVDYEQFILYNETNLMTFNVSLTCNPVTKSVITDGLGAVVWTAQREDVGVRPLNLTLDLRYNGCSWIGSVGSDNNSIKSPTQRFTIQCLELGYALDYYREYVNLQKSYNAEVRQAQLEKQLLDGVGDMVASTAWHGTSSGAPSDGGIIGKTAPTAIVGSAVGSSFQLLMNQYSTIEYNKKLTKSENKLAKMQFDTISDNTMSFLNWKRGITYPSVMTMIPDNQSRYVARDGSYYTNLTYNCHIFGSDLYDLIYNNTPKNISGDFDFCNIGEPFGNQLNNRFKHGVTFVNWV